MHAPLRFPAVADRLQRPGTILVLLLLAALPLVWPQLPPLVDLPSHIGRFRVQTAIDQVPALAAAYAFEWRLIGNLGVDLIVALLAPWLGVELATKLVILAIPVAMAAGMLALAREVHGRIPVTALFALPLVYAYPFQFGFVNFWLAQALALPALALWIRLGRQRRPALRAGLFAAIGLALWVVHTVGWGLLGLCAFGSELVLQRRAGRGWIGAAWHAGWACAPLALPLVPTLLVNADSQMRSGGFFQLPLKWIFLISVLRDRWQGFDLASAALLYLVAIGGLLAPHRLIGRNALLTVPAALCALAFLLMPRIATGSNYADMRLVPFTLALALLALDPAARPAWLRPALALAGALFLVARTGATTASFLLYDRLHRAELAALDALPRGAAVLALVSRPCWRFAWATDRLDHLPSMAIVRRDAFTNDQFAADNAQLIRVVKPHVGRYGRDPSQILYPPACNREGSILPNALVEFDRRAFTHVWTIAVPRGRVDQPDLTPVWSNGRSTLYRVDRIAMRETPAGSGTRPIR
jgi:hypothetical protein